MKITTIFTALRNATSDILGMHDLNYQLPKREESEYWFQEFMAHLTKNHYKI